MDKSQHVKQFAEELTLVQRRLYLYILTLVHRADDAEEILQETNRVIWEKMDAFQPGSDFTAWACRIAQYEVLTHRKRTARLGQRFADAVLEQLADEALEVMQQVDHRRGALQECLQKLREGDRELIACRYMAEQSTADVARRLGRSVKSIYQSLSRIRSALLTCIERTLATEGRT